MPENFIKQYLPDESLNKISKRISDVEKKTSGELRVCIKKKRAILHMFSSSRDIAMKEFYKLNMHRTVDKTGVLFLILFDEHKFEIIADEGINSKISHDTWNSITDDLKKYFTDKNYLDGIIYTLDKIGEVLIKEFPLKQGDRDELSNEVIIKP